MWDYKTRITQAYPSENADMTQIYSHINEICCTGAKDKCLYKLKQWGWTITLMNCIYSLKTPQILQVRCPGLWAVLPSLDKLVDLQPVLKLERMQVINLSNFLRKIVFQWKGVIPLGADKFSKWAAVGLVYRRHQHSKNLHDIGCWFYHHMRHESMWCWGALQCPFIVMVKMITTWIWAATTQLLQAPRRYSSAERCAFILSTYFSCCSCLVHLGKGCLISFSDLSLLWLCFLHLRFLCPNLLANIILKV